MDTKKLFPKKAAISSAALAMLVCGMNSAIAARPTSPDQCGYVDTWKPSGAYPPQFCVEFGKRVWSNERFAHPGQQPGMDYPIYIGQSWGPRAPVWFDIGEYVAPSATPDLQVSVAAGDTPAPVTYVVPNKERTSVHFVTQLAGFDTGRSYRPLVEGKFSIIEVMAEDTSRPGALSPVRLRAQRNTTGTGYDGVRTEINANGGPTGPGTLVVWYEPADNPKLRPGTRYVVQVRHRAGIQAIANELPNRPVLKTFNVGVDIVHRNPEVTPVKVDAKTTRFVLPMPADQGRSGWYATTTHLTTTGPDSGTGHCPSGATDRFDVPAVDENGNAISISLRAYKSASNDGSGEATPVACRLAKPGQTVETLVFEFHPDDNKGLLQPSLGSRFRNALPYRIAVRNAVGDMADQSQRILDIELDLTIEKGAATDPKDPVEPKDPVDPVDPIDPVDPVDPVDPTDPTDPTDPVEPVDPVTPIDPQEPDHGDVPATPRAAVPAPKAGQLGGTYMQDAIYSRNYLVRDIVKTGAASKLTYLNYGHAGLHRGDDGLYRCQTGTTRSPSDPFADYGKRFTTAESVDGKADTDMKHLLGGNFNQLLKLKKAYPVKTLISIGGAGLNDRFAHAANTRAGRKALAESCVDTYIKGNLAASKSSAGGAGLAKDVFDGINLEWLSPHRDDIRESKANPIDWDNYLKLVQAFRDALNQVGSNYLLTASLNVAEDIPVEKTAIAIAAELNWVNVRAYDFVGAWKGQTGHASGVRMSQGSPWTNVSTMKQRSLTGTIWDTYNAGLPQEKLVFGIPFHGHGWTNVRPGNSNGLWMAGTPLNGDLTQSVRDYRDIKALRNFSSYLDTSGKGAWRYDGWTFWSYDNKQVVQDKIGVVRNTRAAGVFASNLVGDDNGELIGVMEGIKR